MAFPAFAEDSLQVYNRLDSVYSAKVENDPAYCLHLCVRQENIARQLHNDSLLANAIANKGELFNLLGFLDMALKQHYMALAIVERGPGINYKPRILNDLGMVYQSLSDYKQSNEFFTRSKQTLIATHHYKDTIGINYELGFNLVAMKEVQKGIAILEQNLESAKKQHDDIHIVMGLDNLSNICFEIKDYPRALAYQLDIFNYPKGFESNYRKTGVNEHLAEIYIALKQWDKARYYLQETFKYARMFNSSDWLLEYYRLQAAIAEKTGHYKEALDARQVRQNLKDSIYGTDYDKKIAAISSVYQLEKKQDQIALLEKDKVINAAKVKQQVLQRNAILLSSVLLIGLLGAAFAAIMQRRTKNMQVAFSRSLVQTQEAEKQRISRELHDSIGQNILFIKNQLSARSKDAALEPVMDTIQATIDDVRNISKELYPNQLEKYGLATAVNALTEKMQQATGIFVSSDLQAIDAVVEKEVKINLFRIIQEALNNVIKHANAKAVRITGTKAKNNIALAIMDNGTGFDTALLERKSQTSYGVLNMEERARMLGGKMDLESGAGGTKITITIPFGNGI